MRSNRIRPVVFLFVVIIPASAVVSDAAELVDAGRHVGIYHDDNGRWSSEAADAVESLADGLRAVGFEVDRLNDRAVADPSVLSPDVFDLVILAEATRVPARALDTIAQYSRNGGNLMLLGGPFFESTTWQYGSRSLDTRGVLAAVAEDARPHLLADFDREKIRPWQHGASNPTSESTAGRVEPGADGTPGALRLKLANDGGWDHFTPGALDGPFPPGHTLTTFWAKAGQQPSQLAVEWRERDNSRWIAVVNLSREWKFHVLLPSAFHYWPDTSATGRGGGGDVFKPQNAVSLTIGMAHSHTQSVAPDPIHTIWVDQIGTAAMGSKLFDPENRFGAQNILPRIETVSPLYKLYPVTNLDHLRVNPRQLIAGRFDPPAVAATFAPHPRPQGTGLDKHRRWRYVPLLECLDRRDRICGAAASMLIPDPQGQDGGILLGVPVADPAFFAHPSTIAWLTELAARTIDGVFLYEGGAKYYASFGGEQMPIGAVVVNRGRQDATVTVRAEVRDGEGSRVWKSSFEIALPAGETHRVEAPWQIEADAADPLTVSLTLLRDGDAIDRLDHQVRIWRPEKRQEYMTARGGDFYLGRAKWYAHGVNYMPSTGVAIEDQPYFEFWLDSQPYDPDAIERDLADLEAIGLNVLSAFVYHRSVRSRNLLDFLIRCRDHQLKVNLSLRPGTPMNFRWDEIREIITANRLAQNDTIVAYDVAWEPMWRGRRERRRYDRLWAAWIDGEYGSVEAAEKAWQVPAPREGGQVAGPDDRQVSTDGPWRKMVVDYRRFLNELLDERYGRARDLIRSVDPNHLVSYRMTVAGDPTWNQAVLPHDPAGIAGAVDIMEPEGYGRIGDWDRVRPGRFTVAYCRAVAPRLPVMWAEFGLSVWDRSAAGPTADRLAFAAEFYENFYRMAYSSGANGTIAWYSPGGYRYNEKSDYGITNPDRSWRDLTRVMHRWSERMTEPRALPEVDVWIPIQLDRDADGIAGIYRRVGQRFWAAVEEGKTPGLRVGTER